MKNRNLTSRLLILITGIVFWSTVLGADLHAQTATGQQPVVNEKLAILGLPVRMNVGGHMTTCFLTDFDLSDDTYWALCVRNRTMDSSEHAPVFTPMPGLRQYPYNVTRVDGLPYAFQFVFPGQNEQPLIDNANLIRQRGTGQMDPGPHVANTQEGRPNPQGPPPLEERKKKKKP